ncbi:hypothetical protein DL96DRAFT_1618017 [Flagelloscypha sp. PMI_526]|nr:hypothetical protein DL96DRAFT_1618017 [Flagelloscypha sp. PMI_526]
MRVTFFQSWDGEFCSLKNVAEQTPLADVLLNLFNEEQVKLIRAFEPNQHIDDKNALRNWKIEEDCYLLTSAEDFPVEQVILRGLPVALTIFNLASSTKISLVISEKTLLNELSAGTHGFTIETVWKPEVKMDLMTTEKIVEFIVSQGELCQWCKSLPTSMDINKALPGSVFSDEIYFLIDGSFDPGTNQSRPPIVEKSNDRETVAKAIMALDSPSKEAVNKEVLTRQKVGKPVAVYNYRPIELAPPPISIYHPVFGYFRNEMQRNTDSFEFDQEEIKIAKEFIDASSEYYSSETLRQKALEPINIFGNATRLETFWIRRDVYTHPTLYRLDGSRQVRLPDNPVQCFSGFGELTNGIGEAGCDASEQAMLCYQKYVSSEERDGMRSLSCCPAIIIGLNGDIMAVHGAVFAERFFFERLALLHIGPQPPRWPSSNGSPRSDMAIGIREVAKIHRLIKTAFEMLDAYYQHLKIPREQTLHSSHQHKSNVLSNFARNPANVVASPTPSMPYWCTFTDEYDQKQRLTYMSRLVEDDLQRTVFLASMTATTNASEPIEVVVKFCHGYSKAVHILLANNALAPKLYYAQYVTSLCLWVVVMDFVSGNNETNDRVLTETQSEKLQQAAQLLHSKNLVSGDLRWPNVMTLESSINIIDFEWCR